MRLRLTVVHGTTGGTPAPAPLVHEVEADAPVGSTAGDLVDALASCLGLPSAPELSVGGVAVAPGVPVGTSPLVDGAALTLGQGPHLAPLHRVQSRGGALLWLDVTHGPDAGHALPLTQGRHRVGRSEHADLTLDDPRLSRLHLEVSVDSDSILVRDLSSTNGTRLDGQPLGPDPRQVSVGAELLLGDTELVIRDRAGLPAATASDASGTITVNRRPRPQPRPALRSIPLPLTPQRPHRSRIPWVAILLPIPLAAVMALMSGPAMLAFALMSPLIAGGTAAADRWSGRRTYAAALGEYSRRLRQARDSIDEACRQERRRRRRSVPDLAEVLTIAAGPREDIWESRRSGVLALKASIGTCTTEATEVRLERAAGSSELAHPTIDGVPCTVSIGAEHVTGICGRREDVLGAARAMVGRLLVSHSPDDLRVALITGSREFVQDWTWLSRTPHLRRRDGSTEPGSLACLDGPSEGERASLAALGCELERRAQQGRLSSGGPDGHAPSLLVVLDGTAALRSFPEVTTLLRADQASGVCCLAIESERERLPAEAGAVLDLTDARRPSLNHSGVHHQDLAVDRVDEWWADRLSRSLAPLRDASGVDHDGVPGIVAFGDVVPQCREPESIVELWGREHPGVMAPVGRTADGLFAIDLERDGPHVLIGGTTGSGKSELLRTLVLSLATHYPPDRLSMVLIDYKGGAAFRECARLPHTAGLVTDLDQNLAERALVSLRAELTRRERVLEAAGAGSLHELAVRGTPLPRLVIVIDEFRALVEDLPTFVDGVVRLAALGRSLGIHVVLATQRPAGVISADIKANVNLRIALRVRDRSDSHDVVDAPDAAELDPRLAGRAVARCGSEPLVEFQAAHAGAPIALDEQRGIRIRSADWGTLTTPWHHASTAAATAQGLAECVDAVVAAAALAGCPAATTPWLPPLPETLQADRLPRPSTDWEVTIGLVDRPARQAQEPLALDLRQPGHWGLVGALGSGRTTALLSIARGLTAQRDPGRLHLFAVSDGSLRSLDGLPHCGAHVASDDLPRLERLVRRLADEVSRRRDDLARSGHPSMGAWWASDATGAPPPIVVLIDDWDQLTRPAPERGDHGMGDRLIGLLRDGESVGLVAVIAGDRSLVFGSTAAVVQHRLLLRPADPTDWLLSGIAARQVPAHLPPGRGVLPDGTEFQLALPTRRPPLPMGMPRGPLPPRVDPLPPRVLEGAVSRHPPEPGRLVVGVGGDLCEPLSLDEGRDGRRWLIAGAAGSGVSTTLVLVARALLAQGRAVAVVGTNRRALSALASADRLVTWCPPDDAGALVTARGLHRDLAVIVDDADHVVDSPCDPVLREISARLDDADGLLVCGANSTSLSAQYRGIAVEVARHHTGVLLGPRTRSDSELYGQRLRADPDAPPGRGYLIRRGIATPLQVLMPEH